LKTLYIAGPMSNIPQFNFPLFEAVAVALREDGWTIISPHECDSEETRKSAWASPDGKATMEGSESWGECLARDVKMLADGTYTADERGVTGDKPTAIDGIAFLPNWDKSKRRPPGSVRGPVDRQGILQRAGGPSRPDAGQILHAGSRDGGMGAVYAGRPVV
jgi:hypothetical protein